MSQLSANIVTCEGQSVTEDVGRGGRQKQLQRRQGRGEQLKWVGRRGMEAGDRGRAFTMFFTRLVTQLARGVSPFRTSFDSCTSNRSISCHQTPLWPPPKRQSPLCVQTRRLEMAEDPSPCVSTFKTGGHRLRCVGITRIHTDWCIIGLCRHSPTGSRPPLHRPALTWGSGTAGDDAWSLSEPVRTREPRKGLIAERCRRMVVAAGCGARKASAESVSDTSSAVRAMVAMPGAGGQSCWGSGFSTGSKRTCRGGAAVKKVWY